MDYNINLKEYLINNLKPLFWTRWCNGCIERFVICDNTKVIYCITKISRSKESEIFYAFSITKENLKEFIEQRKGKVFLIKESKNHFLLYGNEFKPTQVETIDPYKYFDAFSNVVHDITFEGFHLDSQKELYLEFINGSDK